MAAKTATVTCDTTPTTIIASYRLDGPEGYLIVENLGAVAVDVDVADSSDDGVTFDVIAGISPDLSGIAAGGRRRIDLPDVRGPDLRVRGTAASATCSVRASLLQTKINRTRART